MIHGDVKPGNILVSHRDGRLRAFVGDFGLTNKSGGTPIFMAPEGLENDSRVKGKTDLYSFAITTLFLTFRIDLAIKLLFLPVCHNVEIFRKSSKNCPLLEVIFETLKTDPDDRPDFERWTEVLDETNYVNNKLSSQNLQSLGVELGPLNSAEEKEMGTIMEILGYFDFEIGSRRVNENEAWRMTAAVSHFEKLTLQTLNNTVNNLSKSKNS